MQQLLVQAAPMPPVRARHAEFVERKGLGHPDSICDAVMEAVSVALSAEYIRVAGRVLHHNVDKGLLVAGQTTPRPGGGVVDAPMRFVFGDRATNEFAGRRIPVQEILEATTRAWLSRSLRFVDPQKHVVFQNELRPGSPELTDIFARTRLTANDTSAVVGYAPLTETERLVLAAERELNSADFKRRFPEIGEDIKVMGVRNGRRLTLTVAAAFVDRFVPDAKTYFERKAAVRSTLLHFLRAQLHDLDDVAVDVNTLDDPQRGLGGMYLTVLGTSAEGADGGQVGRGNRVNGLISLNRPMTTEAAAGKNPVSHVGKIYNLFSHHLAGELVARLPGLEEATVWLCSQIGRPLDDPWSVSVEIAPRAGVSVQELEPAVRDVVESELAAIDAFTERLIRGEFPVC